MTMYKIIGENNDAIRTINSDGSITCFQEGSPGYDKFIQDVAEHGYDIVEGPDVVQPSYADLRRADYPPIVDQLDKIYHSGVNVGKHKSKRLKIDIQKVSQDAQILLLFLIGYILLLRTIDLINNSMHMLMQLRDLLNTDSLKHKKDLLMKF